MRTSRFVPTGAVTILRGRHRMYSEHFKHMKSVYCLDKETNEVVIMTTHPGFWIGRAGKDVESLKEELKPFGITGVKFIEVTF